MGTSDGDGGFWGSRKPAAILKHGILRRYLRIFASKTGYRSKNGRVVYYDGYAGEGRYQDGSDGSPLVAAKVARQLRDAEHSRLLDVFLTEKDVSAFSKLTSIIDSEFSDLQINKKRGDCGMFIQEVLNFADRSPLFSFLDPYGNLVPYAAVEALMNRGSGTQRPPPTEVLINFSAPNVRRVDFLNEARVAGIDAICGGNWWLPIFRSAESPSRGVDLVVTEYAKRFREHVGCYSWVVAVRNRSDLEPIYYLVFFSRHPDGMLLFGDAVSLAQRDWRKACWDLSPWGAEEDADGQILFPVGDAMLEHNEQQLDERWIAMIAENIERLYASGLTSFRVADQYGKVMGRALGAARTTHVGQAVDRLCKAGKIASTGKRSDLTKLVILPPD